jgi:hypothetical protein
MKAICSVCGLKLASVEWNFQWAFLLSRLASIGRGSIEKEHLYCEYRYEEKVSRLISGNFPVSVQVIEVCGCPCIS